MDQIKVPRMLTKSYQVIYQHWQLVSRDTAVADGAVRR
jgi:hypothetical protein